MLDAYRSNIKFLDSVGNINFITGKEMIENLFNVANDKGYFLVLQELMRPSDYKEYLQNIHKNKLQNKVGVSACRTWDINKFPEFDTNFVNALKYLTK